MSQPYLALRHTSPLGFFQGIFATITKARLVTNYPHSGIVIDGILYDSTFKHGVQSSAFNADGWHLFAVENVDSATLINRFNKIKGNHYDWLSLLAFILPFRISVAQWSYCHELSYFMLTGKTPITRITPEKLLSEIFNENKYSALGMVY